MILSHFYDIIFVNLMIGPSLASRALLGNFTYSIGFSTEKKWQKFNNILGFSYSFANLMIILI